MPWLIITSHESTRTNTSTRSLNRISARNPQNLTMSRIESWMKTRGSSLTKSRLTSKPRTSQPNLSLSSSREIHMTGKCFNLLRFKLLLKVPALHLLPRSLMIYSELLDPTMRVDTLTWICSLFSSDSLLPNSWVARAFQSFKAALSNPQLPSNPQRQSSSLRLVALESLEKP